MGINNIEDFIHYKLNEFYKHNPNRKIVKILVSAEIFEDIRQLTRLYTNISAPLPIAMDANRHPILEYNGISIERRPKIKSVVLVPEGSLAEAIYD